MRLLVCEAVCVVVLALARVERPPPLTHARTHGTKKNTRHAKQQAKTHEKVDSIGEERSIGCHAVVMLIRKDLA